MRGKLLELLLRNWPIKVAALALAMLLYLRVQTQSVLTEEYGLQLNVELPPGRHLLAPAPPVRATIAGRGADLLSLRRFPAVITRSVPETLTSATYAFTLLPSDVRLPSGIDATVIDVAPREVVLALDTIALKDVRVVPVIVVPPESGSTVPSSVVSTPPEVRLHGPPAALARVESVTTLPIELGGRPGAFRRTTPIDAGPLAGLRVEPPSVVVQGEVGVMADVTLDNVPITSGAGSITGLTLLPARVRVLVHGLESRVRAFTRDSVQVLAHLRADGDWALLTVVAPPDIQAAVTPESVSVRRRDDD